MSSKSFEELKKELEKKQKRDGLFTDNRWTSIPAYKNVGHIELTYEERLNAVKLHMSILFKQGVFTQEEYEKELEKRIKEIKKEYNIKD